MLPENKVSVDPVPSAFLPPDDHPFMTWEDWEQGGIAHRNTSRGLQYQPWKAWYVGDKVYVQGQATLETPYEVTVGGNASYIALSFDRNMNITLAWRRQNIVYLYWWDSQNNAYVITEFPGARTPRLCHDDKREQADSWDDVLLFYLKEDQLFVRNQRDRYLIERKLSDVPKGTSLYRVGMGLNLRVQLEMR